MATNEESVVDNMKHCYENLILIDVGANLTNKKYSRDLDAVVQRAQDSGLFYELSFVMEIFVNVFFPFLFLQTNKKKWNVLKFN